MFKRLLILSQLFLLLLAACSGTTSDTTTVEPSITQPEELAVQPEPTATSAPKQEAAYDGPQMECTLVSSQPEAPSELVAILSVKEDDWVSGPETAAVTIVEYGDFQ